MGELDLYHSTGHQHVDDMLRGVIGIVETLLPGRVRAYYLHGSFADGTGIETSDIDLFLVARGKFSAAEREGIQRVMRFCALFSPLMAEMIALDEALLLQEGHFRVHSASCLLWGDDLRADMPEQTLAQYLRLYAHFPFVYITQMLRSCETLVAPLTYPQPGGEFYGYDQQLLPPGNEPRHNIKKLVTGVCWAATTLIAWQAEKTVTGKCASVQMYREYVHDEWTTFIEDIYTWGNQRWHYLVPQAAEERKYLRELCRQTLTFEQHYLHHYQTYLLAELRMDVDRQLTALRQLSKFPLNEEGIATLAAYDCHGNPELQKAVAEIMQER